MALNLFAPLARRVFSNGVRFSPVYDWICVNREISDSPYIVVVFRFGFINLEAYTKGRRITACPRVLVSVLRLLSWVFPPSPMRASDIGTILFLILVLGLAFPRFCGRSHIV